MQISIGADGLVAAATVSHTIENKQVAEALLDVYLGENTITPSTLASVAEGISSLL
jgi:lactate dehydrogenase-like 2-hydroxyacid dehydrogenase